MTIAKAFASVLNQYCEEHHLSSREFSLQVGSSYPTVRRWMGGQAPKESVVREVCGKIGVDFDTLLGGGSAEPKAESGLTLAILQARYQQWIKTDPLKAHEILRLAGVVAYNRTLRLGLRANLTITSQSLMIIKPDDWKGWALVIRASEQCILIEVRSMCAVAALSSESLDDISLKNGAIRVMQLGAQTTP